MILTVGKFVTILITRPPKPPLMGRFFLSSWSPLVICIKPEICCSINPSHACLTLILYRIIARIFPIVPSGYTNIEEATEATSMGIGDLLVNFFTVSYFSVLLSRRALLPLIVMAVIFGFGVQRERRSASSVSISSGVLRSPETPTISSFRSTTSMWIRSPSSTKAMGPPSAASGET